MSNLDRREFLSRSAIAGAGFTMASAALAQNSSPSNSVTVGVMGLSRGKALAAGFAGLEGVNVKYVCDVDTKRADACAALVQERTKRATEAINDFRKILDDPGVDALVCAAPNHWHAPATILACSAGKHVYVEKPCSHNAREGEMMVAAARKHKRAVQMGSQRRSGPVYQAAIKELRDGVIGRVYCSRSYYNNARGSIGKGKPAKVPEYLNYELWQGPAPRRPYQDNVVHYNWHWFWHWGNGELGNNGVHSLDISRWGLGVDYPIRVTSSGGRYAFNDDQQTPDTHIAAYEFEGDKAITWQGLSCNRHRDPFVIFYGTEGALEIDGGGTYKVFDKKDKLVRTEKGSRGDREHMANLVEAIRNDKPLALNAEIEEGHKSTLMCHLGNIAYRVGHALDCDPQNGHIKNDKEAMELWGREYAQGWEPKI